MHDINTPLPSAETQGIHLPPGPSIGVPMRMLTEPGGGLVTEQDVFIKLWTFIVHPFPLRNMSTQFDHSKAASVDAPLDRRN